MPYRAFSACTSVAHCSCPRSVLSARRPGLCAHHVDRRGSPAPPSTVVARSPLPTGRPASTAALTRVLLGDGERRRQLVEAEEVRVVHLPPKKARAVRGVSSRLVHAAVAAALPPRFLGTPAAPTGGREPARGTALGEEGGGRDSNPRPPGPQPGALPTELPPPRGGYRVTPRL
jgi:hypothetical protein